METRELEMVFLVRPEQMERLPRVLRSLAATVRTRPLRRLQDHYLDTSTRLLMRSGTVCRLRQVGKRRTLTLKSLTPFRDGLADRLELNEDLPHGDWTQPGPLPGHEVRTRLLPLAHRLNVCPLFALNQERRVYDVRTRDGAHLEVSVDRTSLAGSARADILHRIEIELRTGPVESLSRFASELQRRMGLQPATESKFAYGLREAGLAVPVLAEGPTRGIRPRDAVRRTVARVLMRHLRRMLWHVPGTRLGVNPECLHQMRVSLRRLRAIVRMFRAALPPCTAAKVAAELKWLGQSLGAVRDFDVHFQESSAMLSRLPEPSYQAADKCRSEMRRRRERVYDALRRDLRNPRFRALQETLRQLLRMLRRPVAAGRGEIARVGTALLKAELKKILKAGRAIGTDSPDGALHRLRVRCKRLRYACEALSDLYGKPVAKMARRLAALQDVLGAHHDAVAAQALIDRTIAETAAATPDGVDIAFALGHCAAGWGEEQLVRRAAFPEAWKAFDRKKTRRAFLKAMRRLETGKG